MTEDVPVASVRVDLGTNAHVPLVFSYAKKASRSGFLNALTGDTVEPALLMSMHPLLVLQTYPTLKWIDLFRTGKVNAMHLVCGEWGSSLTPELAVRLGIRMETLIETGLTCVRCPHGTVCVFSSRVLTRTVYACTRWNAIALAGKKPEWYVTIAGAESLEEFDAIPGSIPLDQLNWTQDEIEASLKLPMGAIEYRDASSDAEHDE